MISVRAFFRKSWYSRVISGDTTVIVEDNFHAKFKLTLMTPCLQMQYHERLGFKTRNYYLGWSDWGNADDTPVATGAEPGPNP